MADLKLIALDDQDLEIISAHVQDAVMKVGDLEFMASNGRFVMAMNRFVWENKQRLFSSRNERRRSVLHFEAVKAVRIAGFSRDQEDEILSILAIRFQPGDAPAGVVEITCAGGAAIRLDVAYIEARFADLGAAWETASRPLHKS